MYSYPGHCMYLSKFLTNLARLAVDIRLAHSELHAFVFERRIFILSIYDSCQKRATAA